MRVEGIRYMFQGSGFSKGRAIVSAVHMSFFELVILGPSITRPPLKGIHDGDVGFDD